MPVSIKIEDTIPSKTIYEIKEAQSTKDIDNKPVQIYKTVGCFSIEEIESKISRLTSELDIWKERLRSIKGEEIIDNK
jgi:hypothetical protein